MRVRSKRYSTPAMQRPVLRTSSPCSHESAVEWRYGASWCRSWVSLASGPTSGWESPDSRKDRQGNSSPSPGSGAAGKILYAIKNLRAGPAAESAWTGAASARARRGNGNEGVVGHCDPSGAGATRQTGAGGDNRGHVGEYADVPVGGGVEGCGEGVKRGGADVGN
jgi:hypothetical protein